MQRLLCALLLLGSQAEAAITFRDATNDDAANNTTTTVDEGSGWAQDDIVQCVSMINVDVGDWTTVPADFTAIDASVIASVGAPSHEIGTWYKIRGSGAGNALTFATTATSGSIRTVCWAIDGVDTTTPFATTFSEGSHFNQDQTDENFAAPSIAAESGDLVVAVWIAGQSNCTVAGAPSGYTLQFSDVSGANNRQFALATKPITSGTTETPGAWTHTCSPTGDNARNLIFAYNPDATALAFTVAPTEAPATNGYTISGTVECGGVCTVYAVASPPAVTAPNCTQVKAGQDGSPAAAAIAANEVWTSGQTNNFPLTIAGAQPRHDVYVCASDTVTNTTVTELLLQDRSPDTNQNIIATTSPSNTGWLTPPTDVVADTTNTSATVTGFDDTSDFAIGAEVTFSSGFASPTATYVVLSKTATSITVDTAATSGVNNVTVEVEWPIDPAVVANDMQEIDNVTSGSKAITHDTDGDFTITAAGTALQDIDYCLQDVGEPDGEFNQPEWSADCDVKIYVNNVPPDLNIANNDIVVLAEDVTITAPTDYGAECSDAQTKTIERRAHDSGALPAGTTLSAAGLLEGTPNTENEAGVTLKMICRDAGGLADLATSLVYVVNTVTMPTIDDSTEAAAEADMLTARQWNLESIHMTASYQCGVEAANQVLSQTPAASTEIGAFEDVSIVVSTGACGVSDGQVKLRPGPRITRE
jgi:hypothetical protein